MKILITGANGFVGSALLIHLLGLGHNCIGVARRGKLLAPGVSTATVGNIAEPIDWSPFLNGVDCVIHLAGRAHQLNDKAADPEQEFRLVNYEATISLVRQAAAQGVKKFIYLSTIGVHGQTSGSDAFTELSPFAPSSHYTKSKLDAEIYIQENLRGSEMQWVIVRPPLVYSAKAPGNFGLLLKIVSKGVPLPFAGVRNLRSMVALENLIDFIAFCLTCKKAIGHSFVISDDEELSISEIVASIAAGMNKNVLQFSIPLQAIRWCAGVIGRQNMYSQLFENLRVDSTKAQSMGWQPITSTRTALKKAGSEFISQIPTFGV